MRAGRSLEKPVPTPPASPPAETGNAPKPIWRAILREPVAIGLTPLILVRPWLDGVTYPTANFYFVWGAIVLACLFVARMLVKGAEPRFKWGTALLAGFWLVGLITFATTVQFNLTYRAVIIWAGYLFLFLAVVNGVRTRASFAIVLTAFLASVLAESAYSLFHYQYILPLVRETILRDPSLVRTRFGADIASAELAHRLQVNRAFGSLLYPNALAAFLVLSLPIVAAQAVVALRELWKKLPAPPRDLPTPWQHVLTTLAFWFLLAVVAHLITEAIGMFEYPPAKHAVWRHGPLVCLGDGSLRRAGWGYLKFWSITTAGAPLVAAAAMSLILKKRGYRVLWLSLRGVLLPLLLVIEAAALWLTFSRGGILAIAAATALSAALMVAASMRAARIRGKAASIAAILLLLAAIPALIGQGPPPPAPEPPAPAAQTAPPAAIPITKEGMDLTAADLMNPASFRLRVSYWQTGLRMAADNFWTGVGLGNFGTVYPNYKQPGAGEVKAAHNDYLQALCETGIGGFALFMAFWAYFMAWAAARIYRETDPAERWTLVGLYAGLLAFLAHSLVDFNFFNPALAFFAFLAAGLFVSRALLNAPEPAPAKSTARTAYQIVALPVLLIAALICGMGLRVYIPDLMICGYRFLAVGDDQKLDQILSDGQFFFPPAGEATSNSKLKAIPARHLGGLLPDAAARQAIGSFVVREGNPPKVRRLQPEEPVPRSALYVVTDIEKAKQQILPYVEGWLSMLQRADALYPHDAKLAAYFMKWYDLMVFALPDGDTRSRYILEYAKWAQETVRRSPREFQYRTALAKALWLRANIETAPAARWRFFQEGLEAYKQAMQLFPASPNTTRAYGRALVNYGQAIEKDAERGSTLAQDAARLINEGQQMLRRADQLQQGLPL
ncbi:MAG: O-antigen ligase family protein [Candidatus Hydrogenedentes bacterium]|nr:O-antigen ligase family protein [Candidatus Hydrogenedentota bacterium]